MQNEKTCKHLLLGVLALGILIVSIDIMIAMDQADREPQKPTMMSFYQQCQFWNKWAQWPKSGQCPGGLQPRWYR